MLLAACGETRGQRVVTGAAGGALAGEVIADEPLAGAVIGGGIGAVALMTDGRPRVAAARKARERDMMQID